MTRLKKGEVYWFIEILGGEIEVVNTIEHFDTRDNANFESGNYYPIKEQAYIVKKHIEAVLKGADVIEMPSESEIEKEALENNYIHKERGDCNYPDDLCVEIFKDGINYLKSKIVK